MTACTNNGGKARRVVTAALVGALSVGAVPAIALATGNDVASDVELQSVPASDLEVAFENGAGDEVEVSGSKAVKLEAGTSQYLLPVSAELDGEDVSISDCTLTYLDKDGKQLTKNDGSTLIVSAADVKSYFENHAAGASGDRTAAGTEYTLRIEYKAQRIEVKFTYAAPSAEGIYACEDGDPEDTTFTYTGSRIKLSFADADGKLMKPADYTVDAYYDAEGNTISGADGIKDAGDYSVVITVNGSRVNVPVHVDPFNLDTAAVHMADTGDASKVNTKDNLLSNLDIPGFNASPSSKTYSFSVASVNGPMGPLFNGGTGKYTVVIEASDKQADAGNVTGSATVTYYLLDKDATSPADLYYGSRKLSDTGSKVSISLADGESFDASKVKVTYDGKTYKGEELELTYEQDGKKVDASALSKPGDCKVYVRLVPFQDDYYKWVGASFSFDVEVSATSVVANAGLTYTFDGKVVADNTVNGVFEPGVSTSYTGSDLMERVGIEVKDEDGKTYAEGTDYTVEIEDEDGKAVESIVDAGTYKITVKPVTFKADGTDNPADWVLTVKVNPMVIDEAVVNGSLTDASKNVYVAWTGEEIAPTFTFYSDGEVVEVPADAYEVTFDLYKDKTYTTVKKHDAAVKDEGFYRATIEAAKGVENYAFETSGQAVATDFEVTKKGVFLDVPAGEWYSQGVYDAAKLGYMNGDGAGYTFSPMRELTRAEAACVLFNMAGGNDTYSDMVIPGYVPEGKVFETGFSDVEGNEFFAKAVAWCEATGVINGYADGTFGVSRKVTNEEFACMLANFAKAKGEDLTVDADATLAEYPDASVVSDWAKDAVAWCVSEGIMGGGANISPAGPILRMRAATMAVKAQPKALDDMVIIIPPANPDRQ